MARRPTAKELTRVFKQLDGDDRERILKHAERLADDTATGDGSESLATGNEPSYLAMADRAEYTHEKEQIEKGHRPDPR